MHAGRNADYHIWAWSVEYSLFKLGDVLPEADMSVLFSEAIAVCKDMLNMQKRLCLDRRKVVEADSMVVGVCGWMLLDWTSEYFVCAG